MGDFGKIGVSAYGRNQLTARRIESLETALAAWLATAPGSFSSPDACKPYRKARAKFEKWSAGATGEARRSNGRDAGDEFEIGLARLGYRAGVVVFNGDPFWILILPSSVDTALERMAAAEVRNACDVRREAERSA